MSDAKYTPGRVVWRELATRDVEAAKGFYGELVGWTFKAVDMGPSGTYTMIQAGERQIGGMMTMPKDAPFPPHWMSYVSVKDVDAAAKTWESGGGKVGFGPQDIPNVGRFATLMDPWGAAITAFKSGMGDPEVGMPKPGEFCWETLSTPDEAKAVALYTKTFGWTTQQGPAGTGTVFAVGDRMEDTVADVQKAEGMPPSWMTYVVVENADTARDRAAKLGAKVVVPLIEIPKIGRISFIADPTGGHIGLFQPQM
jgi:predicted enzyme related to lactoylglutathione lyase